MSRRRSELELFHAIGRDGDAGAFAELSERVRRCVHWVLNRMPGGHGLTNEAEDIVADARLRLEQLRGRGFTGGATEFKTYLYKVVVSACADAGHRERWTVSLDAPVSLPDGDERPLGELVAAMVDPGLAADADLERTETGLRLRRALESLDERCRTLLRGFHLEEVSIKELAEREHARANTLEVALTRCRSRLYAAFLALYANAEDRAWKDQVTRAAQTLSGQLARIFTGWWTENRSVADISKEVGLTPPETKRLLGQAKLAVWQGLAERSVR